jgi:hypothetical protein
MVASNVGRYIYIGKGKLRLSFLKLIVRALLPTTASSGRGKRCNRYMAIALQRAPSSKLKSPHLEYSPDREYRIKETMR